MDLHRLLPGYHIKKQTVILQVRAGYENNVLFIQQRFQIDKPVVFISHNFVP
jgi:hypothetical protein